MIERRWPEDKIGPALPVASGERAGIESVQDNLNQLTPRTDARRWPQSQASQISDDISEGRWLISEQRGQSSLPMPFFVLLVFWLSIILPPLA